MRLFAFHADTLLKDGCSLAFDEWWPKLHLQFEFRATISLFVNELFRDQMEEAIEAMGTDIKRLRNALVNICDKFRCRVVHGRIKRVLHGQSSLIKDMEIAGRVQVDVPFMTEHALKFLLALNPNASDEVVHRVSRIAHLRCIKSKTCGTTSVTYRHHRMAKVPPLVSAQQSAAFPNSHVALFRKRVCSRDYEIHQSSLWGIGSQQHNTAVQNPDRSMIFELKDEYAEHNVYEFEIMEALSGMITNDTMDMGTSKMNQAYPEDFPFVEVENFPQRGIIRGIVRTHSPPASPPPSPATPPLSGDAAWITPKKRSTRKTNKKKRSRLDQETDNSSRGRVNQENQLNQRAQQTTNKQWEMLKKLSTKCASNRWNQRVDELLKRVHRLGREVMSKSLKDDAHLLSEVDKLLDDLQLHHFFADKAQRLKGAKLKYPRLSSGQNDDPDGFEGFWVELDTLIGNAHSEIKEAARLVEAVYGYFHMAMKGFKMDQFGKQAQMSSRVAVPLFFGKSGVEEWNKNHVIFCNQPRYRKVSQGFAYVGISLVVGYKMLFHMPNFRHQDQPSSTSSMSFGTFSPYRKMLLKATREYSTLSQNQKKILIDLGFDEERDGFEIKPVRKSRRKKAEHSE